MLQRYLKAPDTLFARLVLTLFIGLLITQILSSFLQFKIREQQLGQLKRGQLLQRFIAAQQLLPASHPAQQQKILNILSTPHLQVHILKHYPIPDNTKAPKLPPIFARLRQETQQALGDQAPLLYFEASQGYFKITLPLSDGTWLQFQRQAHPGQRLQWTSEIWRLIALLIISVLLLSIYPVMLMMRPLRQLAQAATELGKNLSHPPLSLKGTYEVRQAAAAFNTMQAALQQHISDRTRLLAAISHDLKTPITRLRLRTEFIEDETLRAGFIRDLEEMQQMSSATLDFMRGMDAHEKKQKIDLYQLLLDLQHAFSEMGQDFKLHGKATHATVHPLSIKRCLSNLISNGFKYANTIEVQISNTDNTINICIRDHGKGIPESALKKVLDPYVRLENSRNRRTGGTGLGLSIADNIAKLHSGKLQLSNHPQGGLNACLSLPITSTNAQFAPIPYETKSKQQGDLGQ